MPDTAMNPVVDGLKLPPSKAIAYFRQKLNTPTKRWGELESAAHATAFSVAGATSDALLKDFRTAIGRAISDGTTLQDFRKKFDKIVERHGWAYNGSAGWRAAIIYETNLTSAYQAGRYAQMTTPEALELYPYWQYRHHACQHPRAEHVAWDGTILPNNDQWWATHYPPNGWRCHCTVEVISEGKMERRGWKVSETPKVELYDWKNPATGKMEKVPQGINPGFQSNAGMEWQKAQKERAAVAMRPLSAAPDKPLEKMKPEEKREAQRQQIAALLAMKPRPVGEADAGTLPKVMQNLLKSKTPEVRLSAENLMKNLQFHSEVEAEVYQALPEMLATPEMAFEDKAGDKRLVLISRRKKKNYQISVKTDGERQTNYLLSLLQMSDVRLKGLMRNSKILWDASDDEHGAGPSKG